MRPRRPLLSLLLLAGSCAAKQPQRPITAPATPPPTLATAAEPTQPTPAPDVTADPADPEAEQLALSQALRPCAPDSSAATQARTELTALDTAIAALADDADPKPLTTRINHLINGNGCFAVLLPRHTLEFASTPSLREFWRAGGHSWLQQVLDYTGPDDQRYAWIAPTPRKPLTLETDPKHPLAPLLLCSQRDKQCGSETAPWLRRADTFFAMFDRLRQFKRVGKPPDDAMAACEARALAKPRSERFVEWHECFAESADPHTMLPLGNFRAPKDGWLVIRGRRGHYGFCDEVRAYDLATGAAYIAQSCSGLALTHGGGVDGAKTDAARKAVTRVGRLHVEALREAAWIALLADHAQDNVIDSGHGWHIPGSIEIMVPESDSLHGFGGSWSSSSGQTTLHWSWAHAGRNVAAGTLTWPQDYNDAAREHAVRLLDIAEAGLVEGCAPAKLPDLTHVAGKPPGVNPIDAAPESVSRAQADLLAALARLRTTPICPQR